MREASECPYRSLDPLAYWRRSVAAPKPADLDPVSSVRFKISRSDRVMTAGSCFAQHIARRLAMSGFNYYVAEPGHPALSPDVQKSYNYGTFTARYGNIYTSRQLLQLVQRCTGEFEPSDKAWKDGNRYVDPYRPSIQPTGFASEVELLADRQFHLNAVHQAFESSDVFVFTLGLTEAWMSTRDGAVYPVCPGCGAGTFNSSNHKFVNFSAQEVIDDTRAAITSIRRLNPNIKVILTVSPVPLIATYSGQHVLPATVYSKSVLRVAAETMRTEFEFVDYFPSFEIITGAFNRGSYFEDDLREVNGDGVDHVMRVFMQHYAESAAQASSAHSPAQAVSKRSLESAKVSSVVCDEERLLM